MDNVIKEPEGRSFLKNLLPFFVLAHCAHHLLTALPGPLMPFIQEDFGLSYTGVSLVLFSFSLVYGFSQLPAGWLASRVGPRILLMAGIMGVAVAGVLVGISQSYIMMLVFLGLMGLVAGGYHPSASSLISAWVEPEKRGRALGFHLIGGNASFFLAPLVGAGIAATWGWRYSFIGLAIPTVLLGIIFYVFMARWGSGGQAWQVKAERQEEAQPVPGNRRRLVIFLILIIIAGGAGTSIMMFMPLYIVDQFGVSKQTASSMLSIVFGTGLIASPLGGYLSDRIGRIRIILVVSLAAGIFIYLLRFVPYGWGIGDLFFINGLGIGGMMLIIGICNSVRMPVSESYIVGQTTTRNRSTIYGIYFFAMQEAGAAYAPIYGYLADHYGFHFCFTVVSAVVVGVTLVCSVLLWSSQD